MVYRSDFCRCEVCRGRHAPRAWLGSAEFPAACGSAAKAAIADGPGNRRWPPRCWRRGLALSIGCRKKCAEILAGEALRRGAGLRIDQLQFIAARQLLLGIGLGADADPVDARRRQQRAVGLDADLETLRHAAPRSARRPAAAAARRRCRRHRACRCAWSGHCARTARARAAASANLPPPGPSVPTKSVSQNWQTASARSFSRPLHRLQPAKRRNTAARPVCAPSPCSV